MTARHGWTCEVPLDGGTSDQARRREWLRTCSGRDARRAAACLLNHVHHSRARDEAADAEALFANPELRFDEFAEVLYSHLDRWVSFASEDSGEPPYQIDPWVLGAQRTDWWLRVLSQDVSGTVAVPPRPLHRAWIMRRAFVVADPSRWPLLWHMCSGRPTPDHVTSDALLALLRYRSLPSEVEGVLTEPQSVPDALLGQWQRPWGAVREEVPDSTSREQAQAALSGLLLDPAAEPHRAATLEQVRQAVLSDLLAGRPQDGFHRLDRRFAVLTVDDVHVLLRQAGECVRDSDAGWMGPVGWSHAVLEQTRTRALGFVPLDDATIGAHLRCPVPEHRVQMVLNPFVPSAAAEAAIVTELGAIGARQGGRTRRERDEMASVVGQWWRVLLAVRGWLPARVLEPAMQQVAAWMLDNHPLDRWRASLAVYASRPDGLRSMSDDQLARFDALVDARANDAPMVWAPHRWRDEPDSHVPLMSDAVLRQMLALTGWKDLRLLLDPAVARVLPALPVEARVRAARGGDDRTLATLVDDPDRRVRQHVARNRRASVQTLDRLLDDPDPRVRSQVARNSGVTATHLARMSRDSDLRVSRAASRELLKCLAAA